MSSAPSAIPCIPKETARAANAVFSRGNFYILIGEHLETILNDIQHQCSLEKEDALKVEDVILQLITFFQFVEGLTDVQALDSMRTRSDWKFALHLAPLPAMFHRNALCQFRQKLLIDPLSQLVFQRLIDRLVLFTPAPNNFQHLKSLEVVTQLCSLNRLSLTQQAMYQALEVLAARFPEWLRKIALPHWYGRYNHATPRFDVTALPKPQQFSMLEISADIRHLLDEVGQSALPELSEIQEVKGLENIWGQEFEKLDERLNNNCTAARLIDCEFCNCKESK